MIDIDKGSIFAGRFVGTNDKATAQTVILKMEMPEGSRMLIYFLIIGPDAYAGTQSCEVHLMDEDDNELQPLLKNTLNDQRIQLISEIRESTGSLIDGVGSPIMPFPLSSSDYLKIEGKGLEQNETITVTIRAIIYSGMPNVTAPTADTSLTTDYRKVI